MWLVHRLSFTVFVGEIGEETVHHTCAERLCFNPAHLQLVSVRENVAEMMERRAYRREIALLRARVESLERDLGELRAQADGAASG